MAIIHIEMPKAIRLTVSVFNGNSVAKIPNEVPTSPKVNIDLNTIALANAHVCSLL